MALSRTTLENGFRDLIETPAQSPTEYGRRFASLYFQYAGAASPTPVILGKDVPMATFIAGAFTGPGDSSRCITAYNLALTSFWTGVLVPGGTVTAYLGSATLASILSQLTSRTNKNQAIPILVNAFDASTRLVQYFISPGPPAFFSMKPRHLKRKDTKPKKDALGRRLCRWCRGLVPPPKRNWCSPECINEYKIRSDNAYMREKVFFRDKGICARCGLDTVKLRKIFVETLLRESGCAYIQPRSPEQAPVVERLKALGFTVHVDREGLRSLWEADHIIEVQDGGGACGLDNIQSMCQPCHRLKSRCR